MFKKIISSDAFNLAWRLFAITAAIALLLSVVNFVTKDRIIINERNKTVAAVNEIFPNCDVTDITSRTDLEKHEAVSSVYAAKKDGVLQGICIRVASKGYGGDISMVVGVNKSASIEQVKIISANETPGIGTKALSDEHLATFHGKSSAGGELATITGATRSSKGVNGGITEALKVAKELILDEK